MLTNAIGSVGRTSVAQRTWRWLPGTDRRPCEVAGAEIKLMGVVARPDGTLVLRDTRQGSDPVKLGEELGKSLLERGGREILKEVYGENAAVPVQP